MHSIAPVADEVPAPVADDVPELLKNKEQVSFSCFKVVRICLSLGTPLEAPCDFKGFQFRS